LITSGIDDLDQDPVDLPGKRGLQLIKAQEERRLSVQFQEAGKVEQPDWDLNVPSWLSSG
jgi:hypothetical protein